MCSSDLANDADPMSLGLEGVERIDLNFPKFTDGRAFSQAFLLRGASDQQRFAGGQLLLEGV